MLNRKEALTRLKTESFDLLVIGGGATGAGVALDAQARGLKVALIERADFSSGTSSRSTKLVHGGVRYLEQAFLHLDRSQFRLVRDALQERKVLSEIAPHLVRWLPLLIPMYRRFEAAYYNAGLRMYDWLAGKNLVHRSRFVSNKEALELCPFLKRHGLKGGVIYYDGQFDDARMGLSLALTAANQGATIANYVEVVDLIKTKGQLSGVKLRDTLTGEEWSTSSSVIVNATGPFTDSIRKMDDPSCRPLLKVSSGAHLVLSPTQRNLKVGILIPKTQDKRVLFVLPWLEHVLVGTTDEQADLSYSPKPTQAEIAFIKQEYGRYFEGQIDEKDVTSTWSGLRPLVNEENASGTASLSRDHSFSESQSGLLSIFGGKWTTYRLMAEDTVDRLAPRFKRPLSECRTAKIKLWGAERFSSELSSSLSSFGFSDDTVKHLVHSYGDQSEKVAHSSRGPLNTPLHPSHPMLVGEVVYGVEQEFVCRSSDVLFRRTRLGTLDKEAAIAAFENVHRLLGEKLNWKEEEKKADRIDFKNHL